MKELIIEIKNLKKYYGKTRGVEDVSIEINRGEAYGFIGPNGAGKSTTIKVLMNLINPTEGQIFINGKQLDKNNIYLKEMIGYLPSEINLYDDLTVKELLNFHQSFYKKDLTKNRKRLVNLLKIDELKRIEDLSLGNKKKVGIVLALIHEPKILILDEPTSGLDPIMQNTFYELLKEEKNKGTTILYSTHILNEVSKICDKVGFIKDGILIKEENVEELEKNNITYLTIESDEIEKIKNEFKLKVVSEKNEYIKFINSLEPNQIIKKLSKYNIKKILIEEATIEDIFMEYYK